MSKAEDHREPRASGSSPPESRRRRVESRDRVWLQDSPANLMVINAIFTLDRIGREELRDLWAERVLGMENGHYDRFTWRVDESARVPRWDPDPDFDLDRHIILAPPLTADPTALATRDKLEDYIGRIASEPLPADRPRWQMQIIPEFEDGTTAVVFRIHHVMGDGMALLPVLFLLMDHAAESQADRNAVHELGKAASRISRRASPWAATWAALAAPFLLAQKFAWRRDRSPLHGPALSGTKRVAWTDPLDLGLIKAAKNATGTTVNDVLLSCIVGAFERYLAQHPDERAGLLHLRASMPINVRPLDRLPELGNKFAAVLLALPVGIDDPQERVLAVNQKLRKIKRSAEPLFTYGTATLMLKTLPSRWSRGLIDYFADKCTCVISNIPGPREPVFLAGRRLRSILFWVPQRAGIGLGISMMSFADTLTLGILSDAELVARPRELVEAFNHEFQRLRESLGV